MILIGGVRTVLVVSSQTLKIVDNWYRLIRGIVRGAGHRGALKDCGKSCFVFGLFWGASARPSFSWSKVCLKHLKSLGVS